MKPLDGLSRPRVRILTSALILLLGLSVSRASAGPSRADLTRLVVIGDSLSAGFQNSSLLASQQVHGYAAVVAAQAGVTLPLPLIADPGIPSVLTLVDPGPPPVVVRDPGTSTGRLDPTVRARNLAVPGASVQDALATRPDCDFTPTDPADIDALAEFMGDFVLGLPEPCLFGGIARSQVEWAEALHPTTILVWLGSQDALQAVIFGADPSLVTPVDTFKTAYAELMDRLAATGATLVVANIADVTAIPFLTSAEKVAAIVGLPLQILSPVLGIGPGDFVTPDAFPLIGLRLADPSLGPLPPEVVLDADEVEQIRDAIEAFNAFIAAKAEEKGAALVDINALLRRAQARGIVGRGQRLTTDFLGGLFSLDGIHPTNTGYAVLANQFIKALNRHFAAGIPPVSVRRVAKTDPLVFRGLGHPAAALGHLAPETAATLRAAMGR